LRRAGDGDNSFAVGAAPPEIDSLRNGGIHTRLARSTADLLAIEADLSGRGIGLVVLSMGGEKLGTRNPTSKLMLTILGGVATWEREIILERQREGIAKAKAEGKYKGRKPPSRSRPSRSGRCVQPVRSRHISPSGSGWRGAACIGCLRADMRRIRRLLSSPG